MKKTSAVMEMTTNADVTLHVQMIIFLTTKQGQTESDDEYLSSFNSRAENMNLDGGAHILYSPQIIGKYMSKYTTTEINAEKDILKATCFILRSDKIRNRDMLDKLRRGVYKGRD